MDLEQAFGIVLKRRRKAASLSQEKFAEACDIERTYVSFLERGQRKPGLDMTFRIAQIFNLKASELIAEVEKVMSGEAE